MSFLSESTKTAKFETETLNLFDETKSKIKIML